MLKKIIHCTGYSCMTVTLYPFFNCLLLLLFWRMYIDALCEEINDSLQENGQMSVADISKSFALSNTFLLEVSMCMF